MNESSADALDEDARARAAVLPGVAEHGAGRGRRGGRDVGVGEHDVGRLAAELERDALDRRPPPRRRSARPTSVEPVNATFATSGCSTSRAPAVEPGPATTLTTPSGIPASSAIFSNSSAVSGVSSAGLSTTVLPAASAGAELPRRDRQREVPRRDQRHDAERLAERHRHAAATPGSCPRGCARGAARSSGTCRRPCPSRRARRRSACRRCAPRAPPAPRASLSARRRAGSSSRARSAGRDRAPRRVGGLGASDGGVGVLDAGARDLGQDLLGRRL